MNINTTGLVRRCKNEINVIPIDRMMNPRAEEKTKITSEPNLILNNLSITVFPRQKVSNAKKPNRTTSTAIVSNRLKKRT